MQRNKASELLTTWQDVPYNIRKAIYLSDIACEGRIYMRIFHYRPLALSCFAYLLFTAFLILSPWEIAWKGAAFLALLLIGSGGAVCFLCRTKQRNFRTVALTFMLPILFLLISFVQCVAGPVRQKWLASEYTGESQMLCGVVTKELSSVSGFCTYYVSVETINGQKVGTKALLECHYSAPFHVGDRIRVQADIDAIEAATTAENSRYAMSKGVFIAAENESFENAEIVETNTLPVRAFFNNLRARLSESLREVSGKENGLLASALFLGDRDNLPEEIVKSFRRCGVSHLLALSGLHVTIVLGMFVFIARFFGMRKKLRTILLSFVAMAYLFLIGFPITAVRAVVMVICLYFSELLGEQNDPLTTLMLTGFFMVTVSPTTVLDAGFIMSFSAVFGLIVLVPPFESWLKTKRMNCLWHKFLGAVMTACVATVSVSLATWYFCGEISLIGVFMTVLLSVPVTLVLVLTPFVLLAQFVPVMAPGIMGKFYDFCLTILRKVTEYMAGPEHITVSMRYSFAGWIIGIMTAVLIVMLILYIPRKKMLAIPPLAAMVCFFVCFSVTMWANRDNITASYVVTKSGEQLLLCNTSAQQAVIVDTSAGSFSMFREAENAMKKQAATEIDTLILTHYHRAYMYSVERFAKRNVLREVYLPTPSDQSEWLVAFALTERLERQHTKVLFYQPGNTLYLFRNCKMEVSPPTYLKRSAQPLVVYRFDTPKETLMRIPAALVESSEWSSATEAIGRADILLFGTHGPLVKTPTELPISPEARLLVIDSYELIPFLKLPEDQDKDAMWEGKKIYTSVDCLTFQMNK